MLEMTVSPIGRVRYEIKCMVLAVAFDARQRLWRNKNSGYLFWLAKVFRARMLGGIKQVGAQFRFPSPQQQAGQADAIDQTGGYSTAQGASGGELHMLRQAGADCAHTGEVRGECATQLGAGSGDGHVKQHTPQACCNQQVRLNSS